jgi:cell division septation protein DedD
VIHATAVPENDKKSDRHSVESGSTRHREQTGSPKSAKLPQSKPGRKRYTVQVGAFTNPGIAKQWALEWKARGYMVALKPVARPRTGVIYRLYLGSFTSENQADELVKRLKSREGISALRLLVRN